MREERERQDLWSNTEGGRMFHDRHGQHEAAGDSRGATGCIAYGKGTGHMVWDLSATCPFCISLMYNDGLLQEMEYEKGGGADKSPARAPHVKARAMPCARVTVW